MGAASPTQAKLFVSEMFGPTIQGEGPGSGRRAFFLRLMGCPLSCTWCDTPYTWDSTRFDLRKEGKKLSVESIAASLRARGYDGFDTLVISGGEPLAQQDRIVTLLDLLAAQMLLTRVEIETAGIIMPPRCDTKIHYNVSPKLASSGNDLAKRRRVDVLREFTRRDKNYTAAFKFVITSKDDLAEIDQLSRLCNIPPASVWLMPEGRTPQELLDKHEMIAEAAIAFRFNMCTRLHVLAWGNKRGV